MAETTHHPQHPHGAESFRELLRERIISVRTMDPRLRLVVGAAVAQLLVAAIMVALRSADMRRIIGDVTNGEESTIPVATFVVATIFVVVAWTFVLAGALHAHWSLRVIIVGLFGWAVFAERDVPAQTTAGSIAAAILLALIVAIAVATIVRDRNAGPPGARLMATRVAMLLPLVGGLFITAWLSAQSVDQTEYFTTSVSNHLYNLQYALIPLLVLAGADFADWGHVLGSRGALLVERMRSAWPLLLVTAVVAGGMLADSIRVSPDDLPHMLALGGVLFAAVLLVSVLVRARQQWPAHFPFLALAGVVVVDATMGFLIEHFVQGDSDYVGERIYAITAAVWLALGVVSLIALAFWRRMHPMLVATLTFVVLIGVCDVLFGLSSVAAVFTQLGISTDNASLDLDGIRAVAAIATLVVCIAVLLRRRLREDAWMLGLVLAVDVSIQVLAWVNLLFDHTAHVAESATGGFSVGAAVVLLVALLLELLASGDAITNRHGRWFPRPSRVLMYLGYILMVASAVLFFASLHSPETGKLRESLFDAEQWVQEGVVFLGPALVLALFVGGVARHGRSAPTAVEDAEPGADLALARHE
jgi:hypothetical protein